MSWLPLPLPFSIFFCYFGILLLGQYSRVRIALVAVFLLFIGMLLSSLLVSDIEDEQHGRKLVLLMQYVLPVFALVLGQQFGQRSSALKIAGLAGFLVLSVVVPLQLLASWKLGYGFLSPSAILFSVYQHLQYVPVLFVGIFWLCIFILGEGLRSIWWLTILSFLMGIYVVLSHSMLAMIFMFIAGLVFVARFACVRRFRLIFFITGTIILGVVLGYFYVADKALFIHKFSVMDSERGGLPLNVAERLEFWRFYIEQIIDNARDFFLGHPSPPDRRLYPSAHNYYLDFVFNFGLVGLLPLLAVIGYVVFQLLQSWKLVWANIGILGLAGVVMFFLLVDNSLKVGLRQPYPGICMFFLLGMLLAQVQMLCSRAIHSEVTKS